MNRSDSILEFIDGTLDSGVEQELFEEMAGRPELRTELQQYVQIGQAARNDPEAFAPPAEVERGLLGGLGLLPTAGSAGGAAVTGSSAAAIFSIAGLKSSFAPLLVGFLAGALLIGGGIFFVKDRPQLNINLPGLESMVSNVDSRNAKGSIEEERLGTVSAESSESIDNRSEYSNGSNNANRADAGRATRVLDRAVPQSHLFHNTPINEDKNAHGAEHQEQGKDPLIRSEVLAESEVLRSGIVIDDVDQLVANHVGMERDYIVEARRNIRSVSPDPITRDADDRQLRRGITLAARKNLTSTPFAENDARTVRTQVWENAAVTADVYIPDVDDGFSLVGEIGSERVTQSLFHNRNDSVLIDQKPLLPYFALGVGMEFNVLEVPVHGRVTLGGTFTSGSPMARASLDVDLIKLLRVGEDAPFSIPIGLHTSSFVYTYNGQYMFSGNWGLSAGVGYNFGW